MVCKCILFHNFRVNGIGSFRANQKAQLLPVDKCGVRVLAQQNKSTPGILIDCVEVCPLTCYKLTVWGYALNKNQAFLVALNEKGKRLTKCPDVYLPQDDFCDCCGVHKKFKTGKCDCFISVGVLMTEPVSGVSKFIIRRLKLEEVC